MDGLVQSLELQGMLETYKEQVAGFESLIPFADEQAAGRGLKARYWRRKANHYRAQLETARENRDQTQAALDAFEAYNSPEAQAERFRRGEIDLFN